MLPHRLWGSSMRFASLSLLPSGVVRRRLPGAGRDRRGDPRGRTQGDALHRRGHIRQAVGPTSRSPSSIARAAGLRWRRTARPAGCACSTCACRAARPAQSQANVRAASLLRTNSSGQHRDDRHQGAGRGGSAERRRSIPRSWPARRLAVPPAKAQRKRARQRAGRAPGRLPAKKKK